MGRFAGSFDDDRIRRRGIHELTVPGVFEPNGGNVRCDHHLERGGAATIPRSCLQILLRVIFQRHEQFLPVRGLLQSEVHCSASAI